MSFDEFELSKTLRTSDFRLLSNIQKALKLVAEGHCSVNFAAKICNFSRSPLIHVQKAVKYDGERCVNGRPKLFQNQRKKI
jgi:uncharacterized Fe-S cluster protein YjdI